MTLSNRQFITITICSVLLYTLAMVMAILNYQQINVIPILNALASLIILTYWLNKQVRITTHYFEFREMIALGVEVLIFGISFVTILYYSSMKLLEVIGYFFFGLHFVAIILLLIFSLTFKIKKLF
jgi:hypothetical protein